MPEAPTPKRVQPEPAFELPPVPKAPGKKPKTSSVVAVALGVVLAAVCIGYSQKGSGSSAGSTDVDRSNAAISACEQAILGQLKAPTTAKFSNERYTDSDPQWLVTGDVDAENSFGAMIRNHVDCSLTRGATDTDFAVNSATLV